MYVNVDYREVDVVVSFEDEYSEYMDEGFGMQVNDRT